MSVSDSAHDWDGSYAAGPPAWDIGRPQSAFVRIADSAALTGAVLDVGCGTGEHTILAARRGAHALGVDISQRAIEIARDKAAQHGVDVRFQALDVLHINTLGESFDAILDSGLFHVFDDDSRAHSVTTVHTVLRPGGHLHLMCFSDRQPGDWGPRRVTESELRDVFQSGWRVESLTADHFDINWERWNLDVPSAEAWLADIVRL